MGAARLLGRNGAKKVNFFNFFLGVKKHVFKRVGACVVVDVARCLD